MKQTIHYSSYTKPVIVNCLLEDIIGRPVSYHMAGMLVLFHMNCCSDLAKCQHRKLSDSTNIRLYNMVGDNQGIYFPSINFW